VSDALVGEALRKTGDNVDTDLLSIEVGELFDSNNDRQVIRQRAMRALSIDLPTHARVRRPFHWCIEFPEVFLGDRPGFTAIVGNPPFVKGHYISSHFGSSYRRVITNNVLASGVSAGLADLVAYFFVRAEKLVSTVGTYGLLATNSIADGDTNKVALSGCSNGASSVYRADLNVEWPGDAGVVVSSVFVSKFQGKVKNIYQVKRLAQYLAGLSQAKNINVKNLNQTLACRLMVLTCSGKVIY